MPILKTNPDDEYGRLVDDKNNDLGLLVSDLLEPAPLFEHFGRLAKAKKGDARIELLNGKHFALLLGHAPEAFGDDWGYVLPFFRAYDNENGSFGLRIVEGLPLETAIKMATDGFVANRSDKEFFVFPKDYAGLVDVLQNAKRYDAPDGTITFGRDDSARSSFAQYGPVCDCFGADGAKCLAARIALKNDCYFASPSHVELAENFRGNDGCVMLRPLFVGFGRILNSCSDGSFYISGRSRLVISVSAQKSPS